MKKLVIILGLAGLCAIMYVACSVVDGASWFAGRSVEVVKQEIDPSILLKKYDYLKRAHAQLDAYRSDIAVYNNKITAIERLPNLDRTDRENLMVWQQEQAGIKSAYNELAADYNTRMAEVNWSFCNVGELPRGASEPLPREYVPYKVD